ncbi:L,D-transpeptidase [Brasilonema sp. CT11]|nr:L,D-transpeptidase [Brasilonema sp. CT11]
MINSLFSPISMRPLKLFITGMALTLNVFLIASNQVWAQSKSQTVKEQILVLQQSEQRWIQIKLSNQRLTAWEGDKPVYTFIISTGKKSTPTPTGVFQIQSKQKSARMQGEDYDIPDVPYTMYYSGSYGIHGAYWHKKFGTPMSHGCINVAPKNAKLLFNWASIGTPVVVQR